MKIFRKVSCGIAVGLAVAMTCTSMPFLPSAAETVQAASVKLNRSHVTMLSGTSALLYVSDGSKAVYSSENETVAAVDQDGWITAKTAGTADIKAVVSGQTFTCKVVVTEIPYQTDHYADDVIDTKLPQGWVVSKTEFDGQNAYNIRPKADSSYLVTINVLPIGNLKDMTPESIKLIAAEEVKKDAVYDGTAVTTGRFIQGNRTVYTASSQSQSVYYVRYGEKLVTVKAYFKAEQDGSLTKTAAKYAAQTIKLPGVTVPVKVPAAVLTPTVQNAWISKDKTISITLPDSTWTVLEEADDITEFVSGKNAIYIFHTDGEQFKKYKDDLIIPTTKAEMQSKLDKTFKDTVNEITSFENTALEMIPDYHIYKADFTQKHADGTKSTFTEYGIYSSEELYAVTGTVVGGDKDIHAAVKKSVDSFQFLTDK